MTDLWLIALAFWGIPALTVGAIIASLPNRFHLTALLASVSTLTLGLFKFYGDDFWPRLPMFACLIILPVILVAFIPIDIERLVRRRKGE